MENPMDRRTWIAGTGALLAGAARAQGAARPLKIYIPGGAGGGWDQTGRALGEAIVAAGGASDASYENKGGKGGILGLADFVARYDKDPQALLIGGMVMVGAIAVNRPAVTLAQVTPLARLTSDYMVLVAAPGSKLSDAKALATEMQRDLASVTFVGGSVGGVDHMLAGMIARQLKQDPATLKYAATSSGKEALALLHEGKAQVAISSYSEFKAEIERKAVLPLASSARRALFGVPSLHEQGIYTELANWRGVFAPAGITAEQKQALLRSVTRAVQTPQWKAKLQDNNWIPALLQGKDFTDALEIEQGMAAAVTMMLKLKA
jgi:putative tricarboxylic transport membrane protein